MASPILKFMLISLSRCYSFSECNVARFGNHASDAFLDEEVGPLTLKTGERPRDSEDWLTSVVELLSAMHGATSHGSFHDNNRLTVFSQLRESITLLTSPVYGLSG